MTDPLVRQDYRLTPIIELRPHPRNARKHASEALDQSIAANGFYGAIIAQASTGYILAGNERYERLKARRCEVMPVIWIDVDDATALRILAADNRVPDLSAQIGYDREKLAELLTEIRTDGFDGSGFSEDEFNALIGNLGSQVLNSQLNSQTVEPSVERVPPSPSVTESTPIPGKKPSPTCPECGQPVRKGKKR